MKRAWRNPLKPFYGRTSAAIVNIVGYKPGLSARDIYNRLPKEGVKITYQGLHKALRALEKRGAIAHEGKGWRVTLAFLHWLERISAPARKPPGLGA